MGYFGIPFRNGVPIGLGSVVGFGAQQFDPSELFVGGTAGAWYDPSDLSTLFTTSAGTTQCAMPGGGAAVSVGRMLDKSGNGNHAIAFNDTTARPELRARVNLLTYSEEFNLWSSAGTTVSANATTAPDGTLTADKMVETATTGLHYRLVGSLTTQVASYTLSVSAKAAERKWLILWYSGSGGFEPYAYFDLENGVIGNKSVSAVASILPQSNGFYRCQITITGQAISNASFVVSVSDADNNNPNQTYLGDSSKGIFVWGADLRPANIGANVPAYQRIADANTYDTSGFPLYLRFDGIDDSMYTPANLNLSGTDKVAVFAGVRKLSDAAVGILAELSANWNNNNNTFISAAPDATGASGDYSAASRGTAAAVVNQFARSAITLAPVTNVVTATHDIPGDLSAIRLNGAASGTNGTGDKGSGNFGTYPLFIGARNNSSLWFNGHLHSLIIAGSAVSAGNISATEQWVAGKTGIQI